MFPLSGSSTGCAQCHTCPGGKEALQTAAKDCTPCRPGDSQVSRALICSIRISIKVISGFEQVCTSPFIRLCVRSAAVASSRSTGAGKAVIYARRITTAPWALCHIPPNNRKWNHVHYKHYLNMFVFPSEPRRESHSVSQRRILPRGQHGSELLHGDFLPQGRGHLWICSCHYCPFSYRKWG